MSGGEWAKGIMTVAYGFRGTEYGEARDDQLTWRTLAAPMLSCRYDESSQAASKVLARSPSKELIMRLLFPSNEDGLSLREESAVAKEHSRRYA